MLFTLNGRRADEVPIAFSTKDRPVRIKFTNYLPTGEGGDLFLPVDTSSMGAGMGPNMMMPMPMGGVPTETVVINGVTFLKETGMEGVTGQTYQWKDYSTARGGPLARSRHGAPLARAEARPRSGGRTGGSPPSRPSRP